MAKAREAGGLWVQTTCSSADLAVLFGISPRSITNLIAQGILVQAEQQGMFQTLPSVHGYLEHLRKKAAGRDGDAELAGERARGAKVERQISEIKLAQLRGENLTLDEVVEEWTRLARSFKGAVMQIASRLRSTISHLTAHDQETAREICTDVLTALAEEIEVGAVGARAEDLVLDEKDTDPGDD